LAALRCRRSQRLVTVEVGQGDERRLAGAGASTPQNITVLHNMAPQSEAAPRKMPAVHSGLCNKLSRFRRDQD